MTNNAKLKLSGIIPPLVTPLNPDFSLDVEALKRIVEHVIKGGVHAVFPLGTTGEFSSFPIGMQVEIIQHVCQAVNGRVPVLIGISSCCLADTLKLAEMAYLYKADAVVATLPFYYSMTQEEIEFYYNELASAVKLPLYLYNMPSRTKIHIEPETVKNLSAHPNIIGLKDSSGDMKYFADLGYMLKGIDFDLYVGPEESLKDSLLLGSKGGVNGGSNLYPELYVAVYNAFQAKDMTEVERLQKQIQKLSDGLYNMTSSPNSYLQGLKTAMSVNGLCGDTLAPPLLQMPQNKRDELTENLKSLF